MVGNFKQMTYVFDDIDDRCFAFGVTLIMFSHTVADQSPDLLDIDGRTVFFKTRLLYVKVSHSDFTEVSGVAVNKWLWLTTNFIRNEHNSLFVEIDPMVMLSTGITSTSGMFAVFS